MHSTYKYIKAFLLGLQSSMEYRGNFLLGLIGFVFPLTIQIFLWTGIFNNSAESTVYGYTYTQMISYSILAVLTSRLIAGGFEWEVLEEIKNGGLSKYIVKPIGYLGYRISCFIGQKSFNAAILFIVIMLVLLVLKASIGFTTGILNISVFLLSIIFSVVINFLIYFSIAALAFWITEAWGAFLFLNVVVNIISGGVFPLDIFGETILNVLNFLPFKYTVYFPVNILSNKLEIDSILIGLAVQVAWILIMLAVTKIIWKLGMRKYTAVGG